MSTADPLDAAVLRSFRVGDEGAVRVVYRRYAPLVLAVARHVVGDRALAEEAVQQTFLQAWRAADRFENGRELAPWLVTIARRVAIDIARRERRRPTSPLDHVEAGHSSLVSLPPSESAAWEVAQVREAIESLAPDEREVVRLQHLEGWTQQEIAIRLGLPLGTVKSRSYRAHRALAARLAHLREATA
ncbi:MAG: sigma-70 family RNA polymerase sigma factor [Actinobacteria bacterium]|nr:sigma-70 family RNA polymerase sigma factor [Actinomycetota bacterium]